MALRQPRVIGSSLAVRRSQLGFSAGSVTLREQKQRFIFAWIDHVTSMRYRVAKAFFFSFFLPPESSIGDTGFNPYQATPIVAKRTNFRKSVFQRANRSVQIKPRKRSGKEENERGEKARTIGGSLSTRERSPNTEPSGSLGAQARATEKAAPFAIGRRV